MLSILNAVFALVIHLSKNVGKPITLLEVNMAWGIIDLIRDVLDARAEAE